MDDHRLLIAATPGTVLAFAALGLLINRALGHRSISAPRA